MNTEKAQRLEQWTACGGKKTTPFLKLFSQFVPF